MSRLLCLVVLVVLIFAMVFRSTVWDLSLRFLGGTVLGCGVSVSVSEEVGWGLVGWGFVWWGLVGFEPRFLGGTGIGSFLTRDS